MHWTAGFRRGCIMSATDPPPVMSIVRHLNHAMNSTPSEQEADQIDSRLPLWMALIANAASLLLSLQFFWVPSDAWIRPMGLEMWILFIGVGTLPVLPLTLFNLRRLRGRRWPKYAVALALTPIPLAWAVAAVARMIIGFHFSQ